MPVDCGGAAVGTAFSSLLLLVQAAAITVAAFRPKLKKIESTLKGMEPAIKENCNIYERLGRLKEMDPIREVLSEGNRLVRECKEIPCYNMCKRYKHSNKLTKYNATLTEKFPILMLLLAATNVAEMLTKMEEKRENLSSICSGQANGQALQSGLGDLGNLAVPVAPPLIVGSEIEASMEENILPLLEEEVPAIVGDAPGGCGETTLLKLCHDGEIKDAGTDFTDLHGAEGIQDLQISNRSTTQNPRNMADHTVKIQVNDERDDNQQPQNQQQQRLQQGWSDSAMQFHIVFGLLKLLTIAFFCSFYTICEVIYLISLVEVTRPMSSNQVYWYSYLIFGTLGFELLLWTNLSLVMWLVINLSSLVVFAAASSRLLMQGFEKNLWFALPFDDMPVSEKFKIFMPLLAVKNGVETLTNMEEIMAKLRSICSGQANGVALQRVPTIAVDASGKCGETTLLKKLCPDGEIRAQALSSSSCHPQDSETVVIDLHRAEEIQDLLISDRSTTQNPRNMVDHTVTIQVKNGRDDDQWP